MRAAIIINPVSGRGPRGMPVPDRTALARRMAAVLDVELDVVVTERAGHGRQIAEACVGAGVDTVVAWGGDGTINEVAAALTGTNTHLGIVPAGSGDGFATALGVPRDPEQALRAALTGAPSASMLAMRTAARSSTSPAWASTPAWRAGSTNSPGAAAFPISESASRKACATNRRSTP